MLKKLFEKKTVNNKKLIKKRDVVNLVSNEVIAYNVLDHVKITLNINFRNLSCFFCFLNTYK